MTERAPQSGPSHAVPREGMAATIRKLIWLYFFLLMIEGALRKWILPGFSDELLLVRDPVLLLIYLLAFSAGYFVFNGAVIALTVLGAAALLTGLTIGTDNLLVTAYGFDACFLHLPLIFIIPQVMDRSDVVRIGRWFLVLTIPAAILMVIQFRSSPDDWINCGAGGGAGAQIRGALGKIRPPAFFTFITGAAQFLACATAFIIYGFLQPKTYLRILLLLAVFCVVIAAVVSTSRLALGGIGLVFLMVGVSFVLQPRGMGGVFRLLAPIGLILIVATNLDIFKEGRTVFEARMEEAGDGGIGMAATASNWTARVFNDFILGFEAMENTPLLGRGLGLGTNVGARLLTGGLGFLAAEGEWARVIIELGPIIGLAYLLVRVGIAIHLLRVSLRSVREGNILPILLFGTSVLLVLTGQFSQATTLGFAVLMGGLCLAAANLEDHSEEDAEAVAMAEEVEESTQKRRGRSAYAEALHADSTLPPPPPS